MIGRLPRSESRRSCVIAAIAVCSLIGIASRAVAQIPAATPAPAAPATVAPAPIVAPARPKPKPKPKHRIVLENSDEVEPAHALVKLKDNTWVYSRPNKWSHNVGQVHKDKFINVTGSTHYYLRVKLKNG